LCNAYYVKCLLHIERTSKLSIYMIYIDIWWIYHIDDIWRKTCHPGWHVFRIITLNCRMSHPTF
jgi:hypothetical protein